MKELVDLDMKGAPYGYTPFCDDRPEMDGFRYCETLVRMSYATAVYCVRLLSRTLTINSL